MNDAASQKLPKRWVGLLLASTLSSGVGHLYLGLFRRALVWCGVQLLPLLLLAALAVPAGVSLTAYWGAAAWLVATWVGQIVDLCLIVRSRFARSPLLRTIAVGALLVGASRGSQFLVRVVAVEAYKTPSASMAPTLLPGDHVLVDKSAHVLAAPLPARGDVIVFRYPDPEPDHPAVDFTKRVIGLPGDLIETSNGQPIINGWKVPSCFVSKLELPNDELGSEGALYVEFLGARSYLTWYEDRTEGGPEGPFRVLPNQVFVLGDNRWNSADSRAWNGGQGGGVPRENVKGSVRSVWLAFDPEGSPNLARIGLSVEGSPRFPDMPDEVASGIERCLAQRPTDVVPPAPKN